MIILLINKFMMRTIVLIMIFYKIHIVSIVSVVSVSSALGLHLIFLLLLSHVPGPGLNHLACGLVVFVTSEEVVSVDVKFLGKQKVCSVADDQVDNLENNSPVRTFLRFSTVYSQCQ